MFQYRNGENIIINDSHSIEDTNYKKSLIVILRLETTLKCSDYFEVWDNFKILELFNALKTFGT